MSETTEKHLFVGSYTGYEPGQLPWVGSKQPGEGILSFLFNSSDGSITPNGKVIKQDSPTWLEVHPNGQFLIATHELSHHTGVDEGVGFITAYKIQPDGDLVAISTQSTGGRGNTCATFDRTGCFLLVTRYWEGGISVLPFDPDTGIIGKVTAKPDHSGTGPDPVRQSMPHPHGIIGDPKTDLVYATDLGTDQVHQYILDTKTGELEPHGNIKLTSGSGPRGIKFHPSLRVAYVNCELDGTVEVCDVDDDKGLVPVQKVSCYPKDFVARDHPENYGRSEYWGAEGCLSPNGAFYYYICRVHQSIAIFNVGESDGKLTFSSRCSLANSSNARNLSMDPSGKFLLVASQDANQVECFRIDQKTGALELTDSQHAPCAADIAVI
ncbi:lactonase family protein [Allomuricauda sp. F6463D]|uniref:lactonase family protein n=1 Tax=Allomuricauda sp. F6463D TaxID=2926409 RepID=UPI001FF4F061|nr:lactonase family protein [Muricauda sp. F6463D]MCK0159208.1 lactonase family protein [Muricauda sp. F6463D]